jgi:predicted metal-dependent phosphoesterase TrpH
MYKISIIFLLRKYVGIWICHLAGGYSMDFIDLHVHSNASDGTLSPEETVALAKEKKLSAIALTDHDTTAGIQEACRAGARLGIEVVPGIEVSSNYNGTEIHILGLFVDPQQDALIQMLSSMRERRQQRNQEMLRRFAADGIVLTKEELCGSNPDTVITRAHVAKALLNRGLGSSMDQIFKRYLTLGGPYCPPKEFLSPEEVVTTLLSCNAFVALAHPFLYKLGDKAAFQLISYLAGLGMQGLEVYHSSNNQLESMKLQKMAADCHLLPTGGSDFHGANKPDISIGTGRGGLKVSSLLLDAIKEYRKNQIFYEK